MSNVGCSGGALAWVESDSLFVVLEALTEALVARVLAAGALSARGARVVCLLHPIVSDATHAQRDHHIASIYHAEALFHTFSCRRAW